MLFSSIAYGYCFIGIRHTDRFLFYLLAILIFICIFAPVKEISDMTSEHLFFITFCVGNLSEALQKSASQVYDILRSSGVLNDYIIPCYDVLHTFSKEYIIEDLTEALRERGAIA